MNEGSGFGVFEVFGRKRVVFGYITAPLHRQTLL